MGAYFTLPWGLAALVALPAIVALHLFRRRFQPRVVSALFLWAPDDHVVVSGRKREPLRQSVSLWSELLAAACLALALAGPRSCGRDDARHLVVVLDGSASMSAAPRGESAAARARAELADRIHALRSSDRVTLIESGPLPRTLAGPSALPAEALERLADWNPRAVQHDFASAFALALQHADDTRVWFYTDTTAEVHAEQSAIPAAVEVIALGRPAQNVAIAQAQRIANADAAGGAGGPERALLSIRSFATEARSVELVLASGAQELARRTLALEPGKSQLLAFDVPAGAPPIEARLTSDDFPFDDRAYLAPPPARGLAVHVELSDEQLARFGLRGAGESRSSGLAALLPNARPADDLERAHLVVSAARAPAAGAALPEPIGAPTAWNIELVEPAAATKAFLGPFLVDRASGLFEGTTWQGVIWSADPQLALPGAPLVTAGTTPLLAVEDLGARRVFRLQLDAARSTLARSSDWPVWLSNVAEARRAELPGAERTSLRARERFVWRGDAPATYRFESGAESFEVPAAETLECEAPGTPGFWKLSVEGRELATLGVSFSDPRESDLARLGGGTRESNAPQTRVRADADWPALLLVALALGALLVDWWSLASGVRRLT
ncbi:MAG: VWA domain-containing protein [Planctomycetota bacterium]|nr:MAG: VWA domain-containing protein [Planctomycetota bacterium]